MKRIWFVLLALALFSACEAPNGQPEAVSDKEVQEIKPEGIVSNADLIRNPVSAEGPTDTVNVAKITFEETEYAYGEVQEGELVEHVFQFTNTGKVPLLINTARSTCGCTVPEWPKQPIPPGGKGEIAVKFDTTNKFGRQNKPVNIVANTYPARTTIYLNGEVRAK